MHSSMKAASCRRAVSFGLCGPMGGKKLVALAAFASACVVGAAEATLSFTLLGASAGFVGTDPINFDFFDTFDINNPVPGTIVQGYGHRPGALTVSTRTEYVSLVGSVGTFAFEDEVTSPGWSFPTPSIAACRSLIAFTTDTEVLLSFSGLVTASGTGRGFIDLDALPPATSTFASGAVNVEYLVGAGTHYIVMGGALDPAGGFARFAGSMTATPVPAPAATALFAVVGLATRRRRRS